ncbi:unnamed protein product [Chrysoparadoxa australica]
MSLDILELPKRRMSPLALSPFLLNQTPMGTLWGMENLAKRGREMGVRPSTGKKQGQFLCPSLGSHLHWWWDCRGLGLEAKLCHVT